MTIQNSDLKISFEECQKSYSDKNIDKIKWITQALALPNLKQKTLYPKHSNIVEEMLINWENSFFALDLTVNCHISENQRKAIINFNNAIEFIRISESPEYKEKETLLSSDWQNLKILAAEVLSIMRWEKVTPSINDMLYYPWQHDICKEYLKDLSDIEYQYKIWVKFDVPEGTEDGFDFSIHFLYDDTELAENPKNEISWILKNTHEAKAISNLTQQIDYIFNIYGKELSDKEYIEKPEWQGVIKAAQDALQVFNT